MVIPGTLVPVRQWASGALVAPLVGRVSMDMLTIDLTEVPGAIAGDPVVLWGDALRWRKLPLLPGPFPGR